MNPIVIIALGFIAGLTVMIIIDLYKAALKLTRR